MAAPTNGFRQTPLSCPGHTRPVVHIHFSGINKDGKFYFISASKGMNHSINSELSLIPMFHLGMATRLTSKLGWLINQYWKFICDIDYANYSKRHTFQAYNSK